MTLKTLIVIGLVCGVSTLSADETTMPKSVPPVIGKAVVVTGPSVPSDEWQVKLLVPKIRWQIVGEIVPKEQWPEINAEVQTLRLDLKLGGPSQLSESRFVTVTGEPLSRSEVTSRLKKETPVLISITGEMPDEYFLSLTKPDAIIVILGTRDGIPAPELLPAERR